MAEAADKPKKLSAMTSFVSRTFRKFMAMATGTSHGGDRDLYEVFGYPAEITPANYLATYLRGDIAGRIIDAYPDATWREPPAIRKKGAKADDDFTKEVNELAEKVNLWGVLQRLDRLTGLGHYGVLLIGLDGGEMPDQPTRGRSYDLLYLTPHGETSAEITEWEQDPRNARYAKPKRYRVTAGVSWTGTGGATRTLAVDWSRTLHIAERCLEDDSIGLPRLERIFNRLMDLDKVLGGGAEVFWQNAANIRAWIADADATWDPAEKAAMEAELEEMQHGLRRDVRLRGVKPENLAGTTEGTGADKNIEKQLDMISGASGIPKRILIGSERGELSSEQDENNWAARIMERRAQYATPNIIRPLLQRFIELGILSNPGEFDVIWPESDTLGEETRAKIALTKAQAVAAYIGTPGTDAAIALEEFRRWLGEDIVSEFMLEEREDPEDNTDEGNAEKDAAFNARARRLAANAQPRTLYVRRDVLNWKDIAAWAKAQGFITTLAEAMHVTIAFSRQPMDWMKVSEPWNTPKTPGDVSGQLRIAEGGPRVVEALGDQGAAVLFFQSSDLRWRNEAIRSAGASWEYDEDYQPHITISYAAGVPLAEVEPYGGPIILGPEIFEEIDDTWSKKLVEHGLRVP